MNERILELAMRANSHHGNSFDLNYKELDVFLSEFAELIVRECGRVYIQNQQDGVMTLTQDLLQHFFGVKE